MQYNDHCFEMDQSGHTGAAANVASRGLEAALTRGTEPQKTSPQGEAKAHKHSC